MLTFNEIIPSIPYLEVGRPTGNYAAFNSAQIMKSVSAGSYSIVTAGIHSHDETDYLLSTRANREALEESIAQLARGESKTFSSVKELDKYISKMVE